MFCDHPAEESELLIKLIDYIHRDSILVTYNGHAFDLPFLNKRYIHHGIDFQCDLYKNFDLYRVVRASKKALGLDNYKLKTIELYLNIERQDQISGKESVDLYYQYVEYPTKDLRDIILLHNYDDIKYMIPTLRILNHIPDSIIEKYFPFSFIFKGKKLFIKSYDLTPSHLMITLTQVGFDKVYHYHQHYSLTINTDLQITVPIFSIGDRHFIDVDLIDFLGISFNDLTYEEQVEYELKNLYSNIDQVLIIFSKL